MYTLRIGSLTDYTEFSTSGDPMPKFNTGRTNIYNQNGSIVAIQYNVSLTCYYPGDSGVTGLWTDWDNIEARMNNQINDIRLYYSGSLIHSWLESAHQASPRITVLNPTDGRGMWATYLQFDLQIFIEKGFTTYGSTIVEYDRQITTTIENGKETTEGNITARGTGAESAVKGFKYTLPGSDKINFEQVVEQRDQNTWTATYRTVSEGNTTLSGKESISVEGGGRDKKFSRVTGTKPVEFDGPLREVMVTITGSVTASELEALKVPNRDAFPGHVPDDRFSLSGGEMDSDGNYTDYELTYDQLFLLQDKTNLPRLLSIKSLSEINAGGKIATDGKADSATANVVKPADIKKQVQKSV